MAMSPLLSFCPLQLAPISEVEPTAVQAQGLGTVGSDTSLCPCTSNAVPMRPLLGPEE